MDITPMERKLCDAIEQGNTDYIRAVFSTLSSGDFTEIANVGEKTIIWVLERISGAEDNLWAVYDDDTLEIILKYFFGDNSNIQMKDIIIFVTTIIDRLHIDKRYDILEKLKNITYNTRCIEIHDLLSEYIREKNVRPEPSPEYESPRKRYEESPHFKIIPEKIKQPQEQFGARGIFTSIINEMIVPFMERQDDFTQFMLKRMDKLERMNEKLLNKIYETEGKVDDLIHSNEEGINLFGGFTNKMSMEYDKHHKKVREMMEQFTSLEDETHILKQHEIILARKGQEKIKELNSMIGKIESDLNELKSGIDRLKINIEEKSFTETQPQKRIPKAMQQVQPESIQERTEYKPRKREIIQRRVPPTYRQPAHDKKQKYHSSTLESLVEEGFLSVNPVPTKKPTKILDKQVIIGHLKKMEHDNHIRLNKNAIYERYNNLFINGKMNVDEILEMLNDVEYIASKFSIV